MGKVGRVRPLEASLLAAMLLVWPSVACASFNGRLDFPFGLNVAFGVLGALPGAVVILLLEWQLPSRTPPPWVGPAAALAAVYCLLRLAGVVGAAGDRPLIPLLAAPSLIDLILITYVTSSRWRHAAGWAVAAGSLLIFVLARPEDPARSSQEWGVLVGGAPTTFLLWRIGFSLGQRSLRRSSK